MKRRFVVIVTASMLLAACSGSTTISEWSCATEQPDGCFSVAAGDDIAISALKAEATDMPGKVTLRRMPAGTLTDTPELPTGEPAVASVIEDGQHEVPASELPATEAPNAMASIQRLPDRVAEIWIGPFEDASGNYHPASTLLIIVEPSRWRMDR
jgi:type IV conjugative transfer system lipoprotein TraV